MTLSAVGANDAVDGCEPCDMIAGLLNEIIREEDH